MDFPKNTTPLEKAVDSIDPAVVTAVLSATSGTSSLPLARKYKPLRPERSLFHRLINALALTNSPGVEELSESKKRMAQQIEHCKQVAEVLIAAKIPLNTRVQHLDSSETTMLDELACLIFDYPEELKELSLWFVQQGAAAIGTYNEKALLRCKLRGKPVTDEILAFLKQLPRLKP